MSKQEIKKMKKTLKQKIKRGQEFEEYEYDYCDEWNIKYTTVINADRHCAKLA